MALDLATIGHALATLEEVFLGPDTVWRTFNYEQARMFAWYREHREQLKVLAGLKALASTDYNQLNDFLEKNGFERLFDPFDGIGAASILDMLIEWLRVYPTTTVEAYDGKTWREFPAFTVDAAGVEVYEVEGFDYPLARLLTTTGDSLWLMMVYQSPASGLDLASMAMVMARANRSIHPDYTLGAVVPMAELDLKPDLSWLLGASTEDDWVITQAFQMFKLRITSRGARVKVATGIALERSLSFEPEPLVFNQPFIGFFTQKGQDDLPLAAFYAAPDVWREPMGELEDL